MEIGAFIFTWRGYDREARLLEREIGRVNKVTVINSQEGLTRRYPHWIHLGESAFFAAQWNAVSTPVENSPVLVG